MQNKCSRTEVILMTTALVLRTTIELAVVLLLIYGFIKEEKVIAFEQKVWRILFVNYRRYKRKKRYAQMQKNRDFRVVNGTASPRKTPDGSFHVA